MDAANIIFPHQLFENSPLPLERNIIFLVEEFLFFRQYNFHKQKISFHRASMRAYAEYLRSGNLHVEYIEAHDACSDIRSLILNLQSRGIQTVHYIDPTDDWLGSRIKSATKKANINCREYTSPLFVNNREDLKAYFSSDTSNYYQANFYKSQRKKSNLLIDAKGHPTGGKWSFDEANRKKYPRDKETPRVSFPSSNHWHQEAVAYVEDKFNSNLGSISSDPMYPVDFDQSKKWLQQFFAQRFGEFGSYEDAIVADEHILHHSVLSPLLNTGLLLPGEVIEMAVTAASEYNVPLNSLEGFVRQILGWREFVRGVYQYHGRFERTRNFWNFDRKLPDSFYTGTTGIEPVDQTIKKVLATGYCHHIERLMILGNFMLLCEIDPNDVYRWFMELFIDAYDWVMVPNVYGMSQYADGGLLATKPYISGSNYLMKMSNYKKGEWQEVWDGLFWHFIDKQRSFFTGNARMRMMVSIYDKMSAQKQKSHLKAAKEFLRDL
ncbi:MAG: cryptochrome/photolyase family protein [Saprospiraceae bacterium]|nr:cryptochrome/photolyase family protein [Saprospiraceae bacterium]